MARRFKGPRDLLISHSFWLKCVHLTTSRKGCSRGEGRGPSFLFLFLPLLFLFFNSPAPLLADSSNGVNPGGTPFMPGMFGAFGGGSNHPFTPMKSGILKYPDQGHQMTTDSGKCAGFRYNSNPPTSGLMTDSYLRKNDLEDATLSPCTIVNVLHRGNIILFYDPSKISPTAFQTIHGIASEDTSPEGFVQQQKIGYAVTLVKSHFKDPIVLLAWRRLLPMAFLDQMKMNMFLSRYRGQIARRQ